MKDQRRPHFRNTHAFETGSWTTLEEFTVRVIDHALFRFFADDSLSENWMAQANALYQLETSSVTSEMSREGEAGDPGGELAAPPLPPPCTSPGPSGNNNSGSPTSESPSKKRPGEREVYSLMQELGAEK